MIVILIRDAEYFQILESDYTKTKKPLLKMKTFGVHQDNNLKQKLATQRYRRVKKTLDFFNRFTVWGTYGYFPRR